MKKLMMVVVGFGLFSASMASAAVEPPSGLSLALGEKSASQMNGRMLACGRPAKLKIRDSSSEAPRVAQSKSESARASSAR